MREEDEEAGDVVIRTPEEIVAPTRCCDCVAGVQEEDDGDGDDVIRSPGDIAADACCCESV